MNSCGGNDVNPTLGLLRFIGSPFATSTYAPNQDKILELHQHSVKNRMSFFCLETINEKVDLRDLRTLYEKEKAKYSNTLRAIARVSRLLTDFKIEHAVYKTLRPYKSTTVDIDTLIFENGSKYQKAVKAMQRAGYKLIVQGPRSTTLKDAEIDIGIDLYEQVAVSLITYIDKEKLIEYVTTTRLPNGGHVKTLKPEADLVAIIAHSVIKEQIYTLSEYYTFIYYLEKMNINNFIQLVGQNNLTSATRTHAAITALLHKAAHKTIPNELQQILAHLDEEKIETTLLIKNGFKTPHKYLMLTLARSLAETMKGKKCRDSFAMQILHMLNPNFTGNFLKESIQHITRKTY